MSTQINLHKPLVIFDLETTGIHPTHDRIIELFMLKIMPDGTEQKLHEFINPGIPIPKESTTIHGITDEKVKDCPVLKEVGGKVVSFLDNCDLGGYNSNKFDLPMLLEELYRNGFELEIDNRRLVDVQQIFFKKEPRTLAAAYRFYCDKNLDNAHSAESDTRATWEILNAQINKYEDIEGDINFLHQFSSQNKHVDLAGRISRNNEGVPVFNFGKFKGKSVHEVFQKESSYYDWMMRGDFPENTKRVITKIRLQSR